MNKKFSTLVAALLLSGALVSVEAAVTPDQIQKGVEVSSGKILFTENVDLGNDWLEIAEDNVIIDGQGFTLNGRLVIKGNGCTVKNLNIVLANKAGNATEQKTAITVAAKSVTITNNEITCSAEGGNLANAISIFPTDENANIVVENNKIVGANPSVEQWQSAGITVVQNLEKSTLYSGKSATLSDKAVVSIDKNEFEDCGRDYIISVYAEDGISSDYEAIRVSPLYNEKGEVQNASYVRSLVNNTTPDAKVIFNGTVAELIKIAGDQTGENAAVECKDGNVLYGTATNPDNGKGAVIASVKPAIEEVEGHKLIESPGANQYGLLIMTDGNGQPWIVSQAKGTTAKSEQVSTIDLENYVDAATALWKIEHYQTASGEHQYKFVNKLGEELNPANTNITGGVFSPKGNAPYSKYGVVLEDINSISSTTYYSYALYRTADKYFTANDLIKRYGDYFTLDITYKNDKNQGVDVTGVFDGQLRPVSSVTYSAGEATYVDAKTQDEFMLVNGEGNIIVIDTKAPLFEAPSDHGYAFTTITPKQWVEWLNTASLRTKYNYVTNFKLAYDYNNQSTTEAVTSIEIGGYTVGLEKKEGNIILVADIEDHLLDDPTISIKLNAGNGIAAKDWLTSPSYYTIEAINKDKKAPHYGKVLGLNEYGQIAWVAPENVDLTKPEGQFAIDQNYNFKNRENKNASLAWNTTVLVDGNVYKVAGEEDVYAVVTPAGNDTLRISAIKTYKSYDGFKRFTASQLNANTYKVAMKALNGDVNIIENHNDKHRLGLDEENYTEWRIEMPTVKLLDATEDFTRMAADTVKIETPITYYVAGKGWVQTSLDPEDDYYAPNTELQICTYVLKNTDNNEYLNGVNDNESAGNEYYVCNADKKTATRVAFKENGEESYNLVPAYGYYGYYVDNKYYDTNDWMTGMSKKESEYADYTDYLWLSSNKIIGGVSTLTGVLKDEALYKATTNDLFVIEKAEAPTYKKLAQDDKIILTLKENLKDEYVLFEDGDFAGMGNRLAHKDINPTLYVDTAYVNRVGNYAYQYLLSVRPTRIDTTYQCNLPEEHGVHRADTTKGFFLVNMVDSAKANQNVHNNKFMYDGEYKLAFVEGYHTNDSLFFTEEGKVVSKMEVGNGDFNIAKYAFKMVDETENEFVIETASGYTTKKNWVKDNNGNWHWTVASVESKPGYLRWVNDNLVVTDEIDKAAIFTMEASDKEATANENIAAGNVVVAGVNGAVVVKGAEGKNVIVSTILGKVVANEVLTSDNAQIATPAGIVVVSVDGESFKVVVK